MVSRTGREGVITHGEQTTEQSDVPSGMEHTRVDSGAVCAAGTHGKNADDDAGDLLDSENHTHGLWGLLCCRAVDEAYL
ncbi:hypothetical protein SDC9_174177 [bioreactor metagenome]|uniref:Uncharacterized protein n=1 Tax=bioreactor metagenome TaxID=1076179 RepID=A0A645GLK8_9ZZZZ